MISVAGVSEIGADYIYLPGTPIPEQLTLWNIDETQYSLGPSFSMSLPGKPSQD